MARIGKKKRNVGGPRHTPIVVLALGRGPKCFNELEQDTGIPPSTLSRSIKILMKAGMVRTRALTITEEQTCHHGLWKYELTGKGQSFLVLADDLDVALRAFWVRLKK